MRHLVLCCLLLAGCAAKDHFSFIEQASKPELYGDESKKAMALSDQDALRFSSNVVKILRARSRGARITREVSSTMQVSMAAVAGANAAFGMSESALAILGLGSALIPDFQGIFNAKGRAEAYTDAVRLIETAQNDYLAHNQAPQANLLTQNGVTLIQRTQASIHVVEKTLAGRIPGIVEMQQATEPMTEGGAVRTEAGTRVFNYIPPTGDARPKPAAPGPTAPPDLDPNARRGNTTATSVDVQADQTTVSHWITERKDKGDYPLLRQFVKNGGIDPTNLKDAEVVTQARLLVGKATERTKIDLLLENRNKPLAPLSAAPVQDPTPNKPPAPGPTPPTDE